MPRILLVAFVATLSSAGCAQHRVMPATFGVASAQAGTTPQQSRPVDRELLRKYVSQLPLGATGEVGTTGGQSFQGGAVGAGRRERTAGGREAERGRWCGAETRWWWRPAGGGASPNPLGGSPLTSSSL